MAENCRRLAQSQLAVVQACLAQSSCTVHSAILTVHPVHMQDCYAGTSQLVAQDPYALEAMPLHLACAVELGHRNELFLRSHRY